MVQKSYDRHHILPTSREGTNQDGNIVRLDIRKHRALHMLFDNRTVPEQIDRLIGIASTALTEEVQSDILEILREKDFAYWYKK